MRRDGFTNGATYEEIIEMSVRSKKTQYDVLESDIKYNPDKISKLKDFYSKTLNKWKRNLIEKLLKIVRICK